MTTGAAWYLLVPQAKRAWFNSIFQVSWRHWTGAEGERLIRGWWAAWRLALDYASSGITPVNVKRWAD